MRDLPPQTGSVLPERDFEMCWELSRGAGPRLAEIEQALRSAAAAAGISSNMGEAGATVSEGQSYAAGTAGASSAARPPLLVLATDPDREGEAISWHLVQELQVSMALLIDVLLQRLSCGCLRGRIVGTRLGALFLYSGPVQDLALLNLSTKWITLCASLHVRVCRGVGLCPLAAWCSASPSPRSPRRQYSRR